MWTSFLAGALTGMGFGAVLYKVGATRYSRVMGMLTLRDTKVMKFAFTAIGVASLLYGLAAALGLDESLRLVPRIMPYLGSAHVVGGVLFGAAMGVSGLCPGTCVAKAGGRGGANKGVTPAAIFGLFAGILLYALLKAPLTEAGVLPAHQKPLTLHGVLGLPYAAVALVFGAAILGVAVAVDRLTPERTVPGARDPRGPLDRLRGEWSWLFAGAVGGALVVAATAQSGYLGFSGAVLALTGWVSHLIGAPIELVPKVDADLVWRAALILGVWPGGALAKALSIPLRAEAEAPLTRTYDARAIGKGFAAAAVMSLGAMIGGGCTTGAFIGAWPTLSLGSFLMAGTFFATSMATSHLRLLALHTLDLGRAQALGDRVYD